jgi:hypothetical protein
MAKYNWIGVNGDWSDAADWSGGPSPPPNDPKPGGRHLRFRRLHGHDRVGREFPGEHSDHRRHGRPFAAGRDVGALLDGRLHTNLKSAATKFERVWFVSVIESVESSLITTSAPTCAIAPWTAA